MTKRTLRSSIQFWLFADACRQNVVPPVCNALKVTPEEVDREIDAMLKEGILELDCDGYLAWVVEHPTDHGIQWSTQTVETAIAQVPADGILLIRTDASPEELDSLADWLDQKWLDRDGFGPGCFSMLMTPNESLESFKNWEDFVDSLSSEQRRKLKLAIEHFEEV